MKTAYIVDLSSSIEKAYYELGIIETHSYITEDDLVQFIICRSTEYNATHSDDRHESNGDLNNDIDYNDIDYNDIDYNEFLMSNMMDKRPSKELIHYLSKHIAVVDKIISEELIKLIVEFDMPMEKYYAYPYVHGVYVLIRESVHDKTIESLLRKYRRPRV